MDEAELRRGADSANARWDNHVAILTGDFLFSKSSELTAELGPEAVRIQAQTFTRPGRGPDPRDRRARPRARTRSSTTSTWSPGKTGSLIATSARYGAMFGGAATEVERGADGVRRDRRRRLPALRRHPRRRLRVRRVRQDARHRPARGRAHAAGADGPGLDRPGRRPAARAARRPTSPTTPCTPRPSPCCAGTRRWTRPAPTSSPAPPRPRPLLAALPDGPVRTALEALRRRRRHPHHLTTPSTPVAVRAVTRHGFMDAEPCASSPPLASTDPRLDRRRIRRRQPRRSGELPATVAHGLDGEDRERQPDQREADQRPAGMSSWKHSTPSANCRIGARYCSSPSVTIETRVAAAPKQSSGIAVTMPVDVQSSACPAPSVAKSDRAGAPSQATYAAANGAISGGLEGQALDRADAGLLLGQPVGAERERQHQRDPGRPSVVQGQHDARPRSRRRSPPTAAAAAARRGAAPPSAPSPAG